MMFRTHHNFKLIEFAPFIGPAMNSNLALNESLKICSDDGTRNAVIINESIILFTMALLSLLLNISFLDVLVHSGGHLPLSIKYSMISGSIAYCIKSAYLAFRALYLLSIFSVGLSNLMIKRKFCLVLESAYGTSSVCSMLTFCFIACDRLWVTVKHNKEADWGNDKTKIFQILVSIWIASAGFYGLCVTLNSADTPSTVRFCYYMAVASDQGGLVRTCSLIFVELCIICIYIFVRNLNVTVMNEMWVHPDRYTLADRFIMWVNLKASRMLLPASTFHAILFVFFLAIFDPLKRYYTHCVNSTYIIFMATSFCLMAFDVMLHPIVCLKFSSNLATIFKGRYLRLASVLFFLTRIDVEVESKNAERQESDLSYNRNAEEINKKDSTKCANTCQNTSGLKTIVKFQLDPDAQQNHMEQMWAMSRRSTPT